MRKVLAVAFAALLSFLSVASATVAAGPIPDEAVAAKHTISVTDVRRLHGYRRLSNDDLMAMPTARVLRSLWKLDHPKPDQPYGAAQYRRLLLLGDSRLETPRNAVGRAIAKTNELRGAITARATRPGTARSFEGRSPGAAGEEITIGGIPVGEIAPVARSRGGARAAFDGGRRADDGMLRLNIKPIGLPDPAQPRTAGGLTRANWNWMGPGNIGGRTRAILIHPTEPDIMWLAAVAGGIWKSIDGGQSWAPLADFMANINVTALQGDPSQPDVIFAGTGEGHYNLDAFRGAGVFRSIDGGATWAQVPATDAPEFYYVNRIAITADEKAMLVATRNGIYRSSNWDDAAIANITFTPVASTAGRDILDIECNPNDARKCVAGGRGLSAWRTTDGGVTWTLATGFPFTDASEQFGGRVELTYAAANPSIVYASVDNLSGEIYRSLDGGATYELRNTGAEFLSGQGWYNNTIWAGDKTRSDLVVVGGLDLHRSTDGGQTLEQISEWWQVPNSAHADHHVITAHPGYNGTTNRIVYFGNDGGIYRNDDVLTAEKLVGWTSLNNGYGVTQFYGGGGNPNSGRVVAGAQDNGTLVYRPPPGEGTGPMGYTAMYGGDGGYSAADTENPNFMYGEYVYLQIHRSVSGGGQSQPIYAGIAEAGDGGGALFIAPFILDPARQATMLAGGPSLWRSENVRAATPSWKRIKQPTSTDASLASPISAISAARSGGASGGSNNIWVGHVNGEVHKTTNGTAQMPAWKRVDQNGETKLPQRFVTRLRIDPNDPQTVYATYSGYQAGNLWKTTNGGNSWRSIGATLPEITVYDVAIHPRNGTLLYAATELGVFASADKGETWWPTNEGPANVAVSELFWMGQKLVAVTHGRGIFWIDLSQGVAVSSGGAGASGGARAAASSPASTSGGGPAASGIVVPVSPLNSR